MIEVANSWIVLKYDVNPNEMVCERCKGKQVLPEGPISVNMLLAMMKSFQKSHKHCKLKPIPSLSSQP